MRLYSSPLFAVEEDAEDDGFDGAELFLGERVLVLVNEGLQLGAGVGAVVEPVEALVDGLVDASGAVVEHVYFPHDEASARGRRCLNGCVCLPGLNPAFG